jgi:hypothetical protein
MKTIIDAGSLKISKRIPDLSPQDFKKLLVNLPDIRLDEVAFPVRGLMKPTLFPGSWRRFSVQIAKASPLLFEQLHFVVTDGGGKISSVPDPTFDPKNPHIILLAGAQSGSYKLLVLTTTPVGKARIVGRLEFAIDSRHIDRLSDGPSLWIEGGVNSVVSGQADWGEGGDKGKTGQVYPEVKPALGTKRVLALLVDTASDRYPAAELPATITDLQNALTDGAVSQNDQVKRSVRSFYEEISYFVKGANPAIGLTIDGRVDGPISLPGIWEDYFSQEYSETLGPDPTDPEPDPDKKKKIVVRRYYGTASHYQPIVDAVVERNKTVAPEQKINFLDFDILCCIIRSVRPTGPTDAFKTYWPRRQYITVKIPAPTEADPSATTDRNMDPFNMPDDWQIFDGRTFEDTMSHEFGHSIGLGDLYTPAVFDVGNNDPVTGPLRNVGAWDTMADSSANSHFSIVSRLKLGWVQPVWLKRYNFLIKNDVDETITLSAVEKGAPPFGSFAGAEVRIGSNWNYYIEYRSQQMGQIGDSGLPANDHVVCTDAIAQGFQVSSARPEVILLWNDPTIQSNGPVLGIGQHYLEQDPTGNGKQIKISVLDIKNGLATVRIQYRVFGIDLGIRPWPASPDRPWQSPDIEIRNEKSKKDPSFFNTAWTGQSNDVVAKITNSGTVDAPNVAVQISVKDYNLGGDTPVTQPLAKVVKDLAAGATVEFTTQWIPPKDGHFCIYVEVLPYATPGPPLLVDMNPGNNVAQSNYSTANLEAASPTERRMATVKIGNPHSKPAIAYLLPSQNNPFYRTYLSNRWIWLKPHEVREVSLMLESRLDWDEEHQGFVPFMSAEELRTLMTKTADPKIIKFLLKPNELALTAYMPDPTTDHQHIIRLLGGVQLQTRSGRAVQISNFKAQGNRATGRITTKGSVERAVSVGQVILIYSNGPNRFYVTLPVVDGAFATGTSSNHQNDNLVKSFKQVQAYYSPNNLYGEAYSDIMPLI